MASRVRSAGAKQSNLPAAISSRAPKPYKDMRGATAIRKSEAALRVERDQLLETTQSQEKRIRNLETELAKATGTAQEREEQLETQKSEMQRAHAQEVSLLTEQHTQTIESSRQQYQEEMQALQEEKEDITSRLKYLQNLFEASSVNSVTGNSFSNSANMAQEQQQARSQAREEMKFIVEEAQTSSDELQGLLQHARELEGKLTSNGSDASAMDAFSVDTSDSAQLRNAHVF